VSKARKDRNQQKKTEAKERRGRRAERVRADIMDVEATQEIESPDDFGQAKRKRDGKDDEGPGDKRVKLKLVHRFKNDEKKA
jgi:hypothetical protein